ncbi:MAG: ATP-binding protein [Phycisphaeraceae bacterium]
MWSWLFIGLGLGVLLAVPIAGVWGRRTAQRVRRLEKRAQAAERLAELGRMTGGLAHEIKNPLSTIGLNIELLREDLGDVAQQVGASTREQMTRVQRRFDSLARETTRLREILEDFLRFAGRLELDREPVDVNELIDELADFYQPQAEASAVRLRTQLDARPAIAMADASLLKQAVLNLLINATQAMSEAREKGRVHGGADELIVRTRRERAMERAEIVVHVVDTGPGMDEATAARVFEPYFSTKRGGSGLGLPTARRIIEEHGGHLDVHAAPGRGCEFVMTLPADEG